jgi:hypothetical protein
MSIGNPKTPEERKRHDELNKKAERDEERRQKIDTATFENQRTGPSMKHGVVALLDAVGVKGIWARSNAEEVVHDWEHVADFFRTSIEVAIKDSANVIQPSAISYPQFSDTMVFTLETDDPASSLPLMAEILLTPLLGALLLGIFLRGAISVGEFLRSETMIIGPAIDEAAEWYNLAEWMGVSFTPSASFSIGRLMEQNIAMKHKVDWSRWFVKYDIPMKPGIDGKSGWALPWPRRAFEIQLSRERTLSPRGALLHAFTRNAISPEVYPKYRNTLSFFDYVRSLPKPKSFSANKPKVTRRKKGS